MKTHQVKDNNAKKRKMMIWGIEETLSIVKYWNTITFLHRDLHFLMLKTTRTPMQTKTETERNEENGDNNLKIC